MKKNNTEIDVCSVNFYVFANNKNKKNEKVILFETFYVLHSEDLFIFINLEKFCY